VSGIGATSGNEELVVDAALDAQDSSVPASTCRSTKTGGTTFDLVASRSTVSTATTFWHVLSRSLSSKIASSVFVWVDSKFIAGGATVGVLRRLCFSAPVFACVPDGEPMK
jgi:hypothetical protein